jgi:hypothetical protein
MQRINAGLLLAGQRVTLRLDVPVARIMSGGALARTISCPSRPKPDPACAELAPRLPSP